MPFEMTDTGLTYSYRNHHTLWVEPYFYRNLKAMVLSLLPLSELDMHPTGKVYAGKIACLNFHARFGLWPRVFKRAHTAETIRQFGLEPYRRFLFFGQNLSDVFAKRVLDTMPILEEVQQDGLTHLIPLVLMTKLPPREMRQLFGKSLWKKLANNSAYRNKLIGQAVITHFTDTDPAIPRYVRELEALPSTLLRKACRVRVERLRLAQQVYPTYKAAVEGLSSWKLTEVVDTLRMAKQLGEKVKVTPYDATYMQRKHAEFMVKIDRERYSPEPFTTDFCYQEGEWVAKKLVSPHAIAMEGAAMHHCVGSYSHSCVNGEYMVFSLRQNGKRYATIGLELIEPRPGGRRWDLQQMHGPCNRPVEDLTGFNMRRFLAEINRE